MIEKNEENCCMFEEEKEEQIEEPLDFEKFIDYVEKNGIMIFG